MAERDDIDKQIDVVEGDLTEEEAARPEYTRVYQVYENSRVPVSKAAGKLWKVRWKESKQLLDRDNVPARWEEAISYYQNDQGGKTSKRRRLSEVGSGKDKEPTYASENVVFANVSALVPATYAKNPDLEVTAGKEENEQRAKLFERLLDTLIKRKVSPGLNLKPKMRRLVVTTMLTNIGYLDLSYVQKEAGSEQAIQEIEALSKELSEAKDIDKVQEIEGKLQALDAKVNLLAPSGPSIRVRHPSMVYIDPVCEDASDLSDASFIIIGDYVRTSFIRAMYGKTDENGEWRSIYQPTHVLPSGKTDSQGHDDEINNFSLLSEGAEHTKYGYGENDKEQFEHNCRTLVWYVWDKTTRRVLMFNDKDWTWPIWVWDDPYNLSRFFPIFPLTFYTDPELQYAKSEVMYYLDLQDEINKINNERARMRNWVMSKVFINKNVVRDVAGITRFLQDDTEDLIHALDLPEDGDISKVLGAFPAPSTQFEGLFDSRPIYEGINRMSSVTPILQNVQFKTNTTNRAIETYESSTQMRLDEKIDAIEDMLGDIGRALLEMAVQFMSEEDVNNLLGAEYVTRMGGWQNMSVQEFNEQFNLDIVGGSTLKPTARVKKEQSAQMGQILGQFANASPMVVVVMLKMLERAFGDDVIITPEEWDMIIKSTMQQMQRGGPGQGQGGEGRQAQGGRQPQEGQQGQGGAGMAQMAEQVEQIIGRLPDEARQALGQGIAEGIPLKQLVVQLTRAAQSQQ